MLPVALGGDDDESNLVTCSGVSNMQKLHFTLEELGWNLRDPGKFDGVVSGLCRSQSESDGSAASGRGY